jgi:hypothetical protein
MLPPTGPRDVHWLTPATAAAAEVKLRRRRRRCLAMGSSGR